MKKSIYKIRKWKFNKLPLFNFAVAFLSIIIGFSLGTQYIAYKLPHLTVYYEPIIFGLYNPFYFIIWFLKAGNSEIIDLHFKIGVLILAGSQMTGIMFLYVYNYIVKQRIEETDVHGSAKWACYKDLINANVINQDKGVYIGGWVNEKARRVEYLKDNSDKHCIMWAATRSGKGVGVIVPTLLSWDGSVLVYDIKGENYALSSGWRKNVLGSKVIKFDPTCNDGSGASFNPLFEIRIGDHEIKDTQNIASMLVDPDGKGNLDHWRQSAHSLLTGVILHVLYARKDKTLRGVANLLSDPDRPLSEVLNSMLKTEHDPEGIRGWLHPATHKPTKTHPVVASVARELKNKAYDECSGIVSTAISFVSMYRDTIIAKNTEKSDFRVIDLIHNDVPVSLYLIVPPSDIARTRPLIRLILNQIGRTLLENVQSEDKFNLNAHKNKLLLMLDEFASLGKLESFQDSLAYMASYGIRAYIIIQDLAQLKNAYGTDESIIGNCHIRITHAANKLETADVISKMTGVATVQKFSKSFSGKGIDMASGNVSDGAMEVSRPLLTPDEIMRLPDDDMVIFVGNTNPIYGRKIKYYKDPVLSKRADILPLSVSDRLSIDYAYFGLPENVFEWPQSKGAGSDILKIGENLETEGGGVNPGAEGSIDAVKSNQKSGVVDVKDPLHRQKRFYLKR
ncbi:MAG: type IV secretory system conjugative DNA transfer family protein [Candidatus Omnitrophica bacterium]|nr:type IV secretory system conjugative DNA transfer family protein [Candidatus Omnitrophota bacterium]